MAGAGGHAGRIALVDAVTGRRLTYGGLREQVQGFAAGLCGLGIGKGDVVAILLPNLPEYPVVFLGTALAGAASTTLNPSYTTREIETQLVDCGTRVVVTAPELAEKASAAAPSGVRLLVVGDAHGDATSLADIPARGPPPPPSTSRRPSISRRSPTRAAPPACPRA